MKRKTICFSVLFLLFIALVIINIRVGSVMVEADEIFKILIGKANHDTNYMIIYNIRLPRIFAAVILGGALALSGYMLQTFFHNPIAGPFVLGISSGEKLCVAILMILSMKYGFYINSISMMACSFIGALVVMFFVLIVSKKVRNMSVLIVCGVMVGYICSALTELLISFADDSNIVNLHNWSLGTFSAISWKDVKLFSIVVVICFILGFLASKKMEAYSYGEIYAVSLGMNVTLFRTFLIIISSILSAIVTTFAGPISFVGIAVPHLIRELLKTDRPKTMIPACFLGGSIFCLLSDLLARSLFAPQELSISTMTAVFGAPVVIALLLNRKKNAK